MVSLKFVCNKDLEVFSRVGRLGPENTKMKGR